MTLFVSGLFAPVLKELERGKQLVDFTELSVGAFVAQHHAESLCDMFTNLGFGRAHAEYDNDQEAPCFSTGQAVHCTYQ
jgi:hypothetical protein